ncbi:MAG: uroporphyrinogen-III synthase [Muribaculaceae bacterium]
MGIKKILVSQPKPTSEKSPYFDIANKYGVDIVFRPFIKVEGLTSREFRQQKISILDHTAIIFTAKTSIDHFFRLAEEMRLEIPDTMKYFCVSSTVANYLQKYIVYRKRKIFHTESNKVEDLIPIIEKHKKEIFLLPVSDVHSLKEAVLENLDIKVTSAIMYRTVSNDFEENEPFDYDVLIFFTPAGILSLIKNFPDFKQGNIKIGCMGTSTKKAIEEAGLRADFEPTPDCPSITGALENIIKKENHVE